MSLLDQGFHADILLNPDAGTEKSQVKKVLTSRIAQELYFVLFCLIVGVVVGAFVPVVGPLVGLLAGLSFAALAVGAESILFPGKPASTTRACLGAFLFVGGAVGLILILGIAILPVLAIDFSIDTGLTISFVLLPILLLCGFYNSRPRSSMEEDIFSSYAKVDQLIPDTEGQHPHQNNDKSLNSSYKNDDSTIAKHVNDVDDNLDKEPDSDKELGIIEELDTDEESNVDPDNSGQYSPY